VIVAAGLLLLGLLTLSGIRPFDRGTWLLEVAPVLVVLPLLALTRRRFALTPLLYGLIFLHACVLMLGGSYTYARVPLGFQIQDWLHLGRNPYDRIGHFFQGFVPVIAAREVLLRHHIVRRGPMLVVLLVSVVLAVSACYELIEWAVAMALGAAATDFLGTQGDPWDTQWDMFMALVGACTALLLLSRWHDRQLARTG
jgi:putative membrane protein